MATDAPAAELSGPLPAALPEPLPPLGGGALVQPPPGAPGAPSAPAAPAVVQPPPGLAPFTPAAPEATGVAPPPPILGADGAPAPPPAIVPPPLSAVVPPPVAPPVARKKVLILCDENLLFSAGIQEAYPDVEFTAATTLARQDLEMLNFDPSPQSLQQRVRVLTDPTKLNKRCPAGEFDALMLFLPGLACLVPPELGTADRPLFAFRIHWFVFHIIRHAKVLLKSNEGKLHLVWPDEAGLMTSPCGAAGIEIPQLVSFCGCKPVEQEFDIEKLEADAFWPFLFGSVPSEPPEWLSGTTIQTFSYDKNNIPVPLSVGLMLHPDVPFVCIKDPNSELAEPPGPNAPLRVALQHEAAARRSRLREIYGPKESADDVVGAFGLIPEPSDDDSLLTLPMEVFMLSLDDVPHITNIMKYQVTKDQNPQTIPALEIVDPRLPSRIVRPPPAKMPTPPPAVVAALAGKRPRFEEWGGMKFFCPLTAICTMTADRMRTHMNGDLYKRLAANTPGWEESADKKQLMDQLGEEEERSRKAARPNR